MADFPACFFRLPANEKIMQTIDLIQGGRNFSELYRRTVRVAVTEQVRSPKGPRRVLSPLHFKNKKPDCEGGKSPSATRLSLIAD